MEVEKGFSNAPREFAPPSVVGIVAKRNQVAMLKIAMFTNTYLPHVGGVARSVKTLEDACRAAGHQVRVVAPEFDDAPSTDEVLRVPAIQNFNGSDFCVRIPYPNLVRDFMDEFRPDVIHSHHPFLLGDSALREAGKMKIPVVFTHHTLYEQYTHYVPGDSEALKRMAIQLAVEYCNLCDLVIAPSRSIADLLVDRGTRSPIRPVPTGIDTRFFAEGDRDAFRKRLGIHGEVPLIGHLGRLAGEKNLRFLGAAVIRVLEQHPAVHWLVVGDGDAKADLEEVVRSSGLADRVHWAGKLTGPDLSAAYAAMDWFVFASQSETQGMVLAEAMAAGKPVVALDGPGVREIVVDAENGFLLPGDASEADFAEALGRLVSQPGLGARFSEKARETALDYSIEKCAGAVVEAYRELIDTRRADEERDTSPWDRLVAGIEVEWDLLSAKIAAVTAAVTEVPSGEVARD